MEDITDEDHKHAKRVCKDFIIKKLGEYHDLSVQSDTLLLAGVFKKVQLDLLTDVDMLLMVEKGIRGGICHAIHSYVKANNKYLKDYDKNKESSYLKYWDVNNLYRWAMSLKLPVCGFNRVAEISHFNEDFMKSFNKDSDEGFTNFTTKNENREK